MPCLAQEQKAADTRPPRWRERFSAGWLFQRQKKGGGALGSFDRNSQLGSEVEAPFRDAVQEGYDDSWWSEVNLPHTWNAHDGSDAIAGYFRGIGWYRKHFSLDEALRRKRVFLELEGVNQVAEFWLNGRKLGSHQGGYTGFEFDITQYVRFGPQANVLTVQVDNLYNPNIAPTVKTDLTFYGGIYRNAWLRFTEPDYISTVYWRTPQVSEASAQIEIHSSVAGGGPVKLLHEILDPENKVVARYQDDSTKDAVARLTVSSPRLWSPDSPTLYRIHSSLFDGSRLVDVLDTPLGFRWFRFDADQGFFLNGKRLQLRGTTWHQSYPGMGDALPDSRHKLDMQIIRDMGCNLFRTSHYPHAKAVIEACDRLGMLVLEEIFVGDEVENTDVYFDIQAKTAEEMIFRDRNNPSVILWGFQGEIDQPLKSVPVVTRLLNRFRELDPTRLATVQDPRVEPVKEASDVVGLYSGDFNRDDRDHRTDPKRKFMIEEYTVANIGRGIYGMGPESEDLGCVKHEEFLAEVNKRPWISGSVIWHQFDYDGEEYDPVIPHVVTFGMADSWRIPKDVFYFYQSQWSGKPMLHICGHWTWPGEEGKKRTVKVYSNCREVELELNGQSLGVRQTKASDGLDFAPLVWEMPYAAGVLKATVRSGAQTLVDIRKTAGPPARIELQTDTNVLSSGDQESFAYLTASIVDSAGTVVPSAFHPVSFSCYGPGELMPQTWPGHETGYTWNAIAGKTAIAFRSTDRIGRAMVSAYSPGLGLGRVEMNIAAKGKKDEMEYRGGATVYK